MGDDLSGERYRRALRALEKAIQRDSLAEFFEQNPLARLLGEDRDTLGLSAGQLSLDTELPGRNAEEASGLRQIVRLYMNVSSLDYRPRYDLSLVEEGTTAWHVIYTPDGRWRFDYLARIRSVLATILGVAYDWFEPVVDANSSVARVKNGYGNADVDEIAGDPLERSRAATKHVRAFWGIDHPNPMRSGASRFDDLWRWSDDVLTHSASLRAARSWRRSYPDLWRWQLIRQSSPPEWHQDFGDWPPREILQVAIDRMDGAVDYPRDIRERALRRRTLELFVGYVGTDPNATPAYTFYDHRLAPKWLPRYVADLRSDEEILNPRSVELARWRWYAALTMLAFTRACAEIGAKTMDKSLQTELTSQRRLEQDWDSRPISEALADAARGQFHSAKRDADSVDARRKLQEAIAKRLEMRQQAIAAARIGKLPSFVLHFSEDVQRVYRSAQIVNVTRERPAFNRHEELREAIAERLPTSEHALRLVQFADFLVHLAATQAPLKSRPSARQRQRFRDFLEQSGKENSVYHLIAHRNEALTRQKRDFPGAIRTAGVGNRLLAATKNNADRREFLEMQEQIHLNLAGSWVQWLENRLSLPAARLAAVDLNHVEVLAENSLRHSSAAVAALDELVATEKEWLTRGRRTTPLFERPRFVDGYVSEGTWAYRALEIHYRCLCAAATVAASFHTASLTAVDFGRQIDETYRRIVNLKTPIPADGLPRFVQTSLWHAFLNGLNLPAIPEHPPNSSLRELRFLTREHDSTESEHAVFTKMESKRLNEATKWLIDRGWNVGAVGMISRESRVGRQLHTLSHGAFGEWRDYWNDNLRHIDEGVRAAVGRFSSLSR